MTNRSQGLRLSLAVAGGLALLELADLGLTSKRLAFQGGAPWLWLSGYVLGLFVMSGALIFGLLSLARTLLARFRFPGRMRRWLIWLVILGCWALVLWKTDVWAAVERGNVQPVLGTIAMTGLVSVLVGFAFETAQDAAAPARRLRGVIWGLGGLGAFWLNRNWYVDQYPWLHLWLTGVTWAWVGAAGLCLVGETARGRPFDTGRMAGVVILLLGFGLHAGWDEALGATLFSSSTMSRHLIAGWRQLTDLDRDGYGVTLGGGDCAPFNPRRNPGLPEILDNGQDENCVNGDLTRTAIEARLADERAVQAKAAWAAEPLASQHRPASVLLVTVDALRADHLGCYGYPRSTSPHLDQWAARSVRFERCYAQASHTSQSVPSFLKSRYPSAISFVVRPDRRVFPIHDRHATMAQVASGQGLLTIALLRISNKVEVFFEPSMGLTAGFHEVELLKHLAQDEASSAPIERRLTDQAIERLRSLETREQPFFLWVHYFAPHAPYVQHPGVPVWGDRAQDRYDSEVALVDQELGRLFAEVSRAQFHLPLIVIVTADHGEALGEHGQFHHGIDVYQEQVRVPLIVHLPGVEPQVILEPVGLIDLGPTIVSLMGLKTPQSFQGWNLLAAFAEPGLFQARPLFIETERPAVSGRALIDRQAIIWGGDKLRYDRTHHLWQLFRLDDDPEERRNVLGLYPERGGRLRRQLLEWFETRQGERP